MTEKELDAGIRRIVADLPAVLSYHTFLSKYSPAGFPDWVFAGPGGVLFRECKSATGKLTAAQSCWLDALRDAGMNAGVWRPEDLLSGRVARELAALTLMFRKVTQ